MGLLRKIFGNGEARPDGADDEAEGSGIRECLEARAPSDSVVAESTTPHSNGPSQEEPRARASRRRPRSAAVLGMGAALDGLAAAEDATSPSTPSKPVMSTDAELDVGDVDDTTLSEASEEFDLSEEELDAWEDLITSDEVVTASGSSVLAPGGSAVRSEADGKEGASNELGAALHLLADFAVRVSIGSLAPTWVPEVRRAATALLSARSVSRDPTSSALLSRLVWLVDGGSREELLEVVSELPARVLGWPEWASDLDSEARRRERRILHELFLARDGFKAEQRQLLEHKMSLEQLRLALPDALAAAFEAPLERARELAEVVTAYSIERQGRPPDAFSSTATISGEGSGFPVGSPCFWSALEELEQHCQKFADCDEDNSTELGLARHRRRDALTRVNLLLAENGEIELLDMLLPCAVRERIRRLRSWFGVDAEGLD